MVSVPHGDEAISIRPATVVESVVASLRKLLLTGELKPNQRIKQGELAQRLGVSPVPVREALQVLQSEGLVTYAPGRGFRVTDLSTEEVEEIDLLARLLETEAFRRGVPKLTDADIAEMENLFEQLLELDGTDDVWLQLHIHRELHFIPVRAAGLPRLTSELLRFWEHTDHHRVVYVFKNPDASEVALGQHSEIIEACRTRDPEAVIAVMQKHRDYALKSILDNFRSDTDAPGKKE